MKLDVRYVDVDRKFDIPDEFSHLIKKVRPNSSRFKGTGFKPSCFSEIKVRDMWDVVSQREDFNSRAFDSTDNELYDVDDYLRNDCQ